MVRSWRDWSHAVSDEYRLLPGGYYRDLGNSLELEHLDHDNAKHVLGPDRVFLHENTYQEDQEKMSAIAEQRLLHAAIMKISKEVSIIYDLNDLNANLNEKSEENGKKEKQQDQG